MDSIREAVRKANEEFYEALSSKSLERMEGLWFTDESVKCVHPGWPMLSGWESIRETWKSIFDSGELLAVDMGGADIELIGDVAWVTCLETVSHMASGKIYKSLAQTTNMFERKGGQWLMVLHHASPVPIPQVSPESLQ